MQIRSFFLIVILGVIAALAAFNWTTFNTPTTLWLGVTTVEAPLGLIMLGMVALLTLFFLLSIGYMQSLSLLESRRQAKALEANRELAEHAEASRIAELKQFIELEVHAIKQQNEETRATVLARMNELDASLGASVEQAGNSLAACIGEMDDRLTRQTGNMMVDR